MMLGSLIQVKRWTECRVCGGRLTPVLSLGEQRLPEFTLRPFEFAYPAVPLNLMLCGAIDCGLLQLEHTAPREWLYQQYWYRSGINESMVRALGEIVDRARELVELEPHDWVMDIGANDGTLLRQYTFPPGFQSRATMQPYSQEEIDAVCPQRIAVDPAENFQTELAASCEMVIPTYFPPAKYDGPKPKVITSIAMFYDLEDPNSFVKEIKRILHPEGVWIIQLGDLLSLWKTNGFDAICHEHLEYYSLTSLINLLHRHDLRITNVEQNNVNGGSIRVVVRHDAPGEIDSSVYRLMLLEKSTGIAYPEAHEELGRVIGEIKDRVIDEIARARPWCDLYGASTKGSTLTQTFGIGSNMVHWAWERSEQKWGRYTATGVKIVSELEGRLYPPKMLVCLPWHFKEGILKREAEYLKKGGKILFPLPWPEIVGG